MRDIAHINHLTQAQLKRRMLRTPAVGQFQRWQVLYLAGKKPAPAAGAIADIVGVTRGTVYQWLHRYRVSGPEAMVLVGRGGARKKGDHPSY
jgi:hypothetical protein